MEWVLTFAALVGGAGLAGTMAWLENRPRADLKARLLPTTPIMFLGILIAILALAYMLKLSGIDLPSRGR